MNSAYINKGKEWTKQEEDVILSMYQNHSADDIAAVLKRPTHTVIVKLRKMGFKVTFKPQKSIIRK